MTKHTSVWDAFCQVAQRQPNAVALLDGDKPLTYGELAHLANAVARALPKNARFVGVVTSHGAPQIATLLGVLKRGAAYVPAEPDFPPERLRFMMREPPVDLVVTEQPYQELFESLPLLFTETLAPAVDDDTALSKGAAQPTDLAYVLYTSGSTGTPKGVCVTNANVCSYTHAFEAEFGVGPGDVVLQQSVCSFDIFVEEVFGALLNGATLAIPPAGPHSDPLELLAYAEQAGVSVVSAFPYLLADWDHVESLPATIRLLISGGDVLRASYIEHLLPQVTIYNTYGPSETTVCASYCCVNDVSPLEDGAYPIGLPIEGVGIALVRQDGSPARPGEIGEICISGKGVCAGYVDASKNSAFRALANGTPAFFSGDLGRWLPDGNLAFCGRKDAQVMIGGKRVEPEEVESVLCLSPEVAAALVVARNDERGLSYLTAYLVPTEPTAPSGTPRAFPLSRVIAQAKRHLTPFMIPEYFVLVDEIPLTAHGKPNAAALPVVLKTPQSKESALRP